MNGNYQRNQVAVKGCRLKMFFFCFVQSTNPAVVLIMDIITRFNDILVADMIQVTIMAKADLSDR